MQWLKKLFTQRSASHGVYVGGEKWNPRNGLSQDGGVQELLGGSFLDIKGNPELRQRIYAATNGTPFIYVERGYAGGMPTPEAARLLLEDFATGLAIPHALIEPGWKERLESIAAGRPVDPSFWQR